MLVDEQPIGEREHGAEPEPDGEDTVPGEHDHERQQLRRSITGRCRRHYLPGVVCAAVHLTLDRDLALVQVGGRS